MGEVRQGYLFRLLFLFGSLKNSAPPTEFLTANATSVLSRKSHIPAPSFNEILHLRTKQGDNSNLNEQNGTSIGCFDSQALNS